MRVEVVPHNPAWKDAYEIEAARIARALGDLVVAVHHIGSTAIPGIVAKPILDILLEVSNTDRLDDETAALEGLWYEAKGEFGIPGRRYFRKNDAAGIMFAVVLGFVSDATVCGRSAGNPYSSFPRTADCHCFLGSGGGTWKRRRLRSASPR